MLGRAPVPHMNKPINKNFSIRGPYRNSNYKLAWSFTLLYTICYQCTTWSLHSHSSRNNGI